ncbi:MAG: hypothetical protein IPI58_08325 [Alphaproteobacteria bacterium]|nr:MAG: hypothetical protein IPI58_08325 [Alphaproteobacteria bacterium]
MTPRQDNMLILPELTDRFFTKGPVRLFAARPCPWRWMAVCSQPATGILVQECTGWADDDLGMSLGKAAYDARAMIRAAS